jgi:hypothetical protein
MLNLSKDPVQPDQTGVHEDEFYELLKTAGKPDTDEDMSTVGTTHVYDEPEDRGEAGTIDAPWGEKGTKDLAHNSNGVFDESVKVRQGVINNSFDGKAQADKADQKLMAANFKHVAKGDFTTHSVHLQPKSVEKISHPRAISLRDQLNSIL